MKRAKKDILKKRKMVWCTGASLGDIEKFEDAIKKGEYPPLLKYSQGTYLRTRKNER